ncbi:hypothetical protein MKQ68_02650 [Chitinophaga horti]|uniref:Uncharacterized protein n=1 Tax=Chitinophaga horti TaxID=2920382 RepID=A0ABY6J3P2_9BACT|nr:hypothetical protein [Chitinophaga horti]UYQ93991.1 hypothetical protein MKQ68_02650 [Chitinophaga horti]
MDQRITIPTGGTFYPLVLELFEQKKNASLLYEDNGVTRANGLITAMYEKDGRQWMQVNGDTEIPIDKLYAVNGTFSADYSEC